MFACSKYRFNKLNNTTDKYCLTSQEGDKVFKLECDNGIDYIILRETSEVKEKGKRFYPFEILINNQIPPLKIEFFEYAGNKSYAMYIQDGRDYCILIEIDNILNQIDLFLFKEKAKQSHILLDRWCVGKINLLTNKEVVEVCI